MPYSKVKSDSFQNFGGINTKSSPYDQGPTEFRDLTNVNFITPGALTKRQGSSLAVGATISGRITGGFEFQRLSGASYLVITANTNAYTVQNTTSFTPFKTGLLNGALFDFIPFVDRLFMANGRDFLKFDGTNSYLFSLPPGLTGSWGATIAVGGALSGTYMVSYGYMNERGYRGPASNVFTVNLNGITFGSITYYGMSEPNENYGITAIQLYRTNAGGVDQFGTTLIPHASTSFTDDGLPIGSILFNDNLWFTTAPRYLEIYNNQLFMGGFSAFPSTAFWSQVGDPEAIDPTFNAEFRTNDGDRITGMKTYDKALIVTKEKSFHTVTGDNPNNFLFQQVSDQYGCISNRAMVTYENLLWFLDTKGIVEYNGANTAIVSNRVEPIFLNMNVDAARENAVAIHARQLNEVWFGIPINGATLNNVTVVYDYVAGAFTKYEGFNPSMFMIAKGFQNARTVYYGGYNGDLHYFGASIYSDDGNSITCMLDTRFLAGLGQSIEAQYRRLFLNVDPISGVTQNITVGLRKNYGTDFSATYTMYQSPFQSRIDFGISAKSIAAYIAQSSASLPFKVFGYTFESRFQRSV